MAQQTMTEKDMYVNAFEREYQTTLKVLRSFPSNKAELKAAPNMKPAREIAWMLVLNQMVPAGVMAGELDPTAMPPAPTNFDEVVTGFEKAHKEIMPRLHSISDTEWNGTIKMPVGPKQFADMRKGDALWFFLNDTIHHRGQFSVFVRAAGAKLPSIYGPTADEQWW